MSPADAAFMLLASVRAIAAPCGCMFQFRYPEQHYHRYEYCGADDCCASDTLAELDNFGERTPLPRFRGVVRVTHQRAADVVSVGYAMAARDRAERGQ